MAILHNDLKQGTTLPVLICVCILVSSSCHKILQSNLLSGQNFNSALNKAKQKHTIYIFESRLQQK